MLGKMIEDWAIVVVLVIAGWCIWVRRKGWRIRWEAALSLSITLQALGFIFCIPALGPTIGAVPYALTHIAHLRDYVGHMFFIAGASAMVYTAAMRLLPRCELEHYMKRIEWPGAAAAAIMLFCITNSRILRNVHLITATDRHGRYCYQDFLDVPCDGWLKAYWLTYAAIVAYILGQLVRLLLVLRTDCRRQSRAVEIFIAAGVMGILVMVVRAADALIAGGTFIPGYVMWPALCVPPALAAYAGVVSWRARPQRPKKNGGGALDAVAVDNGLTE